MAEEKKNRKSSRHFNLEKPVDRSFEIEKDAEEVNLEELKKELLADGKIDAEEVNKLRELLYADGKIDQEEADFLFELNDAVSGKPNDTSWNQFFVEAISDYLLNDEKSPGVIDDEEGKWLIEKIGADGQVDGVEKQLLSHLKTNAKKVPASVTALITGVSAGNAISSDQMNLQQLKNELLADGKIDAEEVNKLRELLYADGKIDQEEADFIFEINDAVSGKKNVPAWNQFFVQAISDFLLNDEKSPGVIDEEEGKWLIEKIGADGQVDGVEKELLINLKKRAKSMPPSVLSLIDGDNKRPDHPIPEGDASDGKSSKWKWLIPAAIVVAAVPSYFLFTGNDDTSSSEDPIVATAPEAGQTNFGDNATNPNASTGESDNPENVADSGGSGENNNGDSDNSTGSSNVGNGDNSSETGNASSPESGNVSSGSGNVGNTSSGAKSSTPQSSDKQSSPNKNATSASSTASTGSNNAEMGKTDTSSRRGSSEPGNSKNSGTSDNPVISGSIEQKALDVIRGIYGNGQVRKDKLGAEYAEIQKLVNEMYRNGRVK